MVMRCISTYRKEITCLIRKLFLFMTRINAEMLKRWALTAACAWEQ